MLELPDEQITNIVNNNTNSETATTTATISSVYATTDAVTITTSAAHGLSVGDDVYVYANTSIVVNGFVTIASIGTTTVANDNFTYDRFDGGSVINDGAVPTPLPLTQAGAVTRNPQAISKYVTRKVTLNSDFYSTDIKAYFLANIPAECKVIPYYRVSSLSDAILEDNDWIPMTFDTVGSANSAGFAEYKYKAPYTVVSGPGTTTSALSTGEPFGTFSVKLVMLSSNSVKIPRIKDLRVLALDD